MNDIKVYTKTGDDGTTALFSGKRVHKHHIRIKAYGSIDELNSWVGLIRDNTDNKKQSDELIHIQKQLLILGSQLASEGSTNPISPLETADVDFIEQAIDRMTAQLAVLRNFVIPGGDPLVSYAHLARCVCRRAEREMTKLREKEKVAKLAIIYINRLSDYFFTLSRKFAQDCQVEEIKWIPSRK
jgi:cob(I)alamin adenosyltransferase